MQEKNLFNFFKDNFMASYFFKASTVLQKYCIDYVPYRYYNFHIFCNLKY